MLQTSMRHDDKDVSIRYMYVLSNAMTNINKLHGLSLDPINNLFQSCCCEQFDHLNVFSTL